tara:strand:- start:1723 stop:2529 length:807 start_codon:yes stop_codon:yes gene_type:complete
MNYHQHSRKRSRLKSTFYAAVIVIVVFFMLTKFVSFFTEPTTLLDPVTSTLWGGENKFSQAIRNSLSFFVEKTNLVKSNVELTDRVRSLHSIELYVQLLEEENDKLRNILGKRGGASTNSIVAAVLAGPGRTTYDTMIVDVGTRDGVVAGNQVIVGEGVLLGEVIEALPRTSKVSLYTAPDVETHVLLNPDNIATVAVGQGGGNYKMIVPRDISILEGSIIKVRGSRDLVLGTVGNVKSDPADPFQEILSKPPVNVRTIKWVEVIVDK